MVYDPELLDQLEALGTASFDDIVWRHMFSEYDPARSNTRGARWNPPGVAAIYTSRERETAIAEADHAIASQPRRPRVSRQLYRVGVTLEVVADLTDRHVLTQLGIGDDQLGSPDHGPCRNVGGAAHWLGCDGILVPSARTQQGTNLVIFADRMDIDAAFEVHSREDLPHWNDLPD